MPRPDLCDITVVLDRSGSMASVASDTVGGFRAFVEDQKKAPGSAVLTLVQFDTEYEFVHRGLPIASVPPLEFRPRGGTALLDAIGRAVVETGERLAAQPESDRPGKVVFVILTDGQENSSREYTRARVAEMIRHQREVYAWDFVFLGANQDAIAVAGSMNIAPDAALTYASNSVGTRAAFAAASRGMTSNRLAASRGSGPEAYIVQADRDAQEKAGAR